MGPSPLAVRTTKPDNGRKPATVADKLEMKIHDLIKEWEAHAAAPLTVQEYAIRLPEHTAARILALADMFPARTQEQLITELLGAALDDLEAAFPYVPGSAVIAEDDHQDPIYEDAGLTPRFNALTRHHLQQLKAQRGSGGSS